MKKQVKQESCKKCRSKKKERSLPQPPKEQSSKWQEFLRRHTQAQEKK